MWTQKALQFEKTGTGDTIKATVLAIVNYNVSEVTMNRQLSPRAWGHQLQSRTEMLGHQAGSPIPLLQCRESVVLSTFVENKGDIFQHNEYRGNGEYVIQLKCQNYVCLGLWTSTQKPPTLGFNRTAVYTLCRSGAAMLCQSRIIRMILCHHLLTTSQFALIAKRLAQLFKFVVCNAFRYSPSLSILIALWF